MQACPKCGVLNKDTAKFCNNCGSRFSYALAAGDVLAGRYRIVQMLGQGGMGAVYRGEDTRLGNRSVAVKENFDASQEAQDQFHLEANTLANLSHPNLPRVIDHFIEASGKQYLVMDFVDGEDLQDKLDARGALSESDALLWVGQVGEALAYLHSRTPPIIHRDIKPANIKIATDGHAMLVDFGIAKQFKAGQKTAAAARAVTSGFSPPEQYGGAITDARSDIHALGATLYCLLTGRTPPDAMDRLAQQAQLIAPRALNPRISAAVESAVLKAMDLNPANRPRTMVEFMNLLPGCAPAGSPISAPPLPAVVASAAPVWSASPAAMNPPMSPPYGPQPVSAPPVGPVYSAPVSSYAGFYDYASFIQRVGAAVVDSVIVFIVMLVLFGLAGAIGSEVIFLLVSLLALAFVFWYYVNGHATTGQTVGKRMLGIKVIGTDGLIISRKRSLGRYLVYLLEAGFGYFLIGFLGYLWAIWDKDKQAWHDKAANTYVVRV